eukprot:747728-Hanusia_phi.AAC.1
MAGQYCEACRKNDGSTWRIWNNWGLWLPLGNRTGRSFKIRTRGQLRLSIHIAVIAIRFRPRSWTIMRSEAHKHDRECSIIVLEK